MFCPRSETPDPSFRAASGIAASQTGRSQTRQSGARWRGGIPGSEPFGSAVRSPNGEVSTSHQQANGQAGGTAPSEAESRAGQARRRRQSGTGSHDWPTSQGLKPAPPRPSLFGDGVAVLEAAWGLSRGPVDGARPAALQGPGHRTWAVHRLSEQDVSATAFCAVNPRDAS